jgi:MoaA/NifB/PqqE/SkfB family radical SAM enzyme
MVDQVIQQSTIPLETPPTANQDDICQSEITTWAMLDLTSKCNLRCVYCYKSHSAGTKREREFDFPMEKLDEVMETLRKRGVGIVGLSGTGETTIFDGWVLVAEKLISMGIHCTITTNFSKPLSTQEAETLAKFGSVQISLETLDPELFNKIRRGGNLRHIQENMEKVQEAARRIDFRPPQWRVAMTINDKVVLHLEETVERCIEWGFEAFTFANMAKDTDLPDLANAMNTYPISWMPEPERTEAYRCVERVIRKLEEKGLTVICHDVLREPPKVLSKESTAGATESHLNGFGAPPPGLGETRLCTDPWEYVMLGAEGSVFPCCVGGHVVGDFNSVPLEQALNGEAMIDIRRRLIEGRLDEPCLHCSLRSLVPLEALRDRVLQLKARKPKPVLPLPVDELNEVFRSWERAGKKIVVYPAGNQARWLALYTTLLKTGVVRAFSDRDPAKIGTTISGVTVYSPEDIPSLDVQGILIVSDRFEEEIYTAFEHFEAYGMKRIKFQTLGIQRGI